MLTAAVWIALLAWGLVSTLSAARLDPGWSVAHFLALLGMVAGVVALVTLPWFLLSAETLDAHQGLAIGSILGGLLVGVIGITIVSNRWRRRTIAGKTTGERRGGSAPR